MSVKYFSFRLFLYMEKKLTVLFIRGLEGGGAKGLADMSAKNVSFF